MFVEHPWASLSGATANFWVQCQHTKQLAPRHHHAIMDPKMYVQHHTMLMHGKTTTKHNIRKRCLNGITGTQNHRPTLQFKYRNWFCIHP